MPVSNQTFVAPGYTPAALLILVVIFTAAVWLFSRPFDGIALPVVIGSGAICIGLARNSWMNSSQHSLFSMTDRSRRSIEAPISNWSGNGFLHNQRR